MAENEVLDVGSPRRYKKWRHSLMNPTATPSEAAACLYEEFSSILKKELRRQPLYSVLVACSRDRATLREAVAAFKNQSLATMVKNAFRIAGSANPTAVAKVLTGLLVDRVIGRSNRYLVLQKETETRRASLENAARVRFESCETEVVGWLAASLQNQPVPRPPRIPKVRASSEAVISRSLLPQKEPA